MITSDKSPEAFPTCPECNGRKSNWNGRRCQECDGLGWTPPAEVTAWYQRQALDAEPW